MTNSKDAEPSELPNGWTRSTMHALGDLVCGTSPPTAEVNRVGNGTPYVTGPEQWDGSVLHMDKWTTMPRKVVGEGYIFITVKGAGVGKLFPGKPAAIGRDIYAFNPHEEIDWRFVENALRFTIQEVIAQARGDIPGLSRKHILDHWINVPPAPEQSRIADRIEELFTDLDAGVAALQRVQKKLKRYRAALLHAAVTGRLTAGTEPPWAKRSEWRKLGELIGEIKQGWSPKCEHIPAEGEDEWAVMTTTAIQPMEFRCGENKRLPTTLEPRPQLAVEPGDMLITRAGPRKRCGITCVVRKTRSRLMLCDKAYRFKADEQHVTADYLELALNARPITDAIERAKTGSSDSGLNLTHKRFQAIQIPVPSLDEQHEIIEKSDEKHSQISVMEAEVERGIRRSGRLRQAILKSAFEGKLVAQNPDDEPASELLARIQAEADAEVAAAPKRTPRKRKTTKKKPSKKETA